MVSIMVSKENNMGALTITLTIGAPGSGKSFWAKEQVATDPNSYVRVNNDLIRAMTNDSWSAEYEKNIIAGTRNFMIKNAINYNKNVIIDNVNAPSGKHFEKVCEIAQEANKDIIVIEKPFYQDLEVLLERDSKREDKACVGEKVVRKWWQSLGCEKFTNYVPRSQEFKKRNSILDQPFIFAVQNKSKIPAIISDLDGTIALFVGKRSPYDATNCDLIDEPFEETIEAIKMYYHANYDIIFCSGREDKYEPETRRFIEKHFPMMKYELFCRKTGDLRKDAIIKEEIYREKIEPRYWIRVIFDDRCQVVNLWRSLGLRCFQVADGNF
jgi:predicted kinase